MDGKVIGAARRDDLGPDGGTTSGTLRLWLPPPYILLGGCIHRPQRPNRSRPPCRSFTTTPATSWQDST